MRVVTATIIALLITTPAYAEGFSIVRERQGFVSIIDGRDLTRFGIKLKVTPEGSIRGRAFGRDVRGAWQWRSGYFCRSLYWGSLDLGPNCQAVKVDGGTIRFISDRGEGDHADLNLR